MTAPKSVETTFGTPQNFKRIAPKREKKPGDYKGGAGLLNHPVYYKFLEVEVEGVSYD